VAHYVSNTIEYIDQKSTMRLIRSLSSSSASCRRHIAVAMSGGVDSSVAAYLLSQRPQANNEANDDTILGIHMSNWDYQNDDTASQGTCWESEWKDAKAVADRLQIPIVHTSFEADYWNDVFEPYCRQLSRSITPNPDVDCNRYIKFGVLKEYLRKRFRIDTLATGHYARLWDASSNDNNSTMPLYLQKALDEDPFLGELVFSKQYQNPPIVLMAARDASKDQSYFLSGVRGDAFRNVLFPLGDLHKTNNNYDGDEDNKKNLSVRDIAKEAQLPTAGKRDSMGICFVGKRKHADFVNEYISFEGNATAINRQGQYANPVGTCINIEDGTVVTTFDPMKQPSLLYATIGQGAKISGASQKWFVVDKPDPTTLLVCPGTHHPSLYADRLFVKDMNWIAGCEPPTLPLRAQCRIRHLQPLVNCEIRRVKEGSTSSSLSYEIILERPLRGIAPGQIVGLYYKDLVCLGGGAISKRGPTYLEMEKDLPELLHPSGQNDILVTQQQ